MSDFLADMKRQQAQLDADDQAAKVKGQLIGRYITHPYADGEAVYKIISVTKTTGRIQVVRIGDGWVLPAWGQSTSLKLTDIREFLRRRDTLASLFARHDDWWAKQAVGTVVHYRNGHGCYVRGTIIEHEGEKKMRPTGLVGSWMKHDLPSRRANGSVHYPYHAENIINGTPMQPNEANMVEANPRPGERPDVMERISLDVPAATSDESELAKVVQAQKAVLDSLAVKLTGDPAVNVTLLREAMIKARGLLNDAL